MKKMSVFCGAIILSASVLAQEDEGFNFDDYLNQPESAPLAEAPQKAIEAAKETCRSWARDDEIDEEEMDIYMRECVDEELKYQGYSPVASTD